MKVFYAFLIMLTATILLMLPLTTMVYDFRTDQKDDTFTITTGAGVTTANVTLAKPLYDDDTQTISFTSNVTETPAVSSYTTSTRQLLVSGLEPSDTRALVVTYDVDAIAGEGTAINTLLDRVPALYLLIIISFPVAGLAAIFLNKA